MTANQLARRLSISPASLSGLKTREQKGGITLGQLQKVAAALGCDFVYAFVPHKPLEKIMRERAQKRAQVLIRKAAIQMELENQGLSQGQHKKQLDDLIDELMFTKDMWES